MPLSKLNAWHSASYPRGAPAAPTEEAPPGTDSAAEEPTGEESEAAADTATE